MAATMKRACFASGVAAPSRSRTVRVCCAKQDAPSKVQGALAAGVAAVLLSVAPAHAGVILEQPQIKKVLQDTTPAAPAPKREIILPGQRSKSAPAAAASKAAAAPRVAETSGSDLDPRSVALPGTIALIAGGAFALSKLDDGFGEFMDSASCKDSGSDGAGYETDLKTGGALAIKKAGTSKAGSKAGTKKVKAATKSTSSPLASFFDK